MTRYCVNRDGNHVGGLNVCAGCAKRFREALDSIGVDTPALLLIAARQAGTGETDRTEVRSRSAHAPLLIREQAGNSTARRAADTARRPAMRLSAGHAQDCRHTRTRTRHPQGRQTPAHGPGRVRMVEGHHRHGPEGQPHRGFAGHTGRVRRMPVLRARRRMGRT